MAPRRCKPSRLRSFIDRQRDQLARQLQSAPLESRTHALLEGMLTALVCCRVELDRLDQEALADDPPAVNADRPYGYDPRTGPCTPQEERAYQAHQAVLAIQKNLDMQTRHAQHLAAIANQRAPLTDAQIQRAEQAQAYLDAEAYAEAQGRHPTPPEGW